MRGRIVARDGTLLACDREVAAVAVAYRYLEEPPRQDWLEQLARRRLTKAHRRDPARLADEMQKLRRERDDLHHRLAALCGIEFTCWQTRVLEIQRRVQRIALAVRRRKNDDSTSPPAAYASWTDRLAAAWHEISEPARDTLPQAFTVAEELSDQIVAEDVPAAAVEEIRQHAELYPGTRIMRINRRSYPAGGMAAHVIGYVSTPHAPRDESHRAEHEEWAVGLAGIERQCEEVLRGQPGGRVELTDHAGRIQQAFNETEPVAGHDVTLTIDSRLQCAAEELLDSAVRRTCLQSNGRRPTGGAAVVIDVSNGEILAAAMPQIRSDSAG